MVRYKQTKTDRGTIWTQLNGVLLDWEVPVHA